MTPKLDVMGIRILLRSRWKSFAAALHLPRMHPSQRIHCSKSERLKGRKVVLGITGSIAAVEDVKLIRERHPLRVRRHRRGGRLPASSPLDSKGGRKKGAGRPRRSGTDGNGPLEMMFERGSA